MGKICDLTKASQEKLLEHLLYFETTDEYDTEEADRIKKAYLNFDLDHSLKLERALVLRFSLIQYFLHYAIVYDDEALFNDLCNNGANVNLVTEDYFYAFKKPLQLAYDFGRANMVDVLIRKGATFDNIERPISMSPCMKPITFAWQMKEWAMGRSVNYGEADRHIQEARQSRKAV